MKKKLIILFAFYFLLTNVGVAFGKHYCGNKASTTVWNISVTKGKGCACKHGEQKKSCCKHSTKWIKAKTDASKTSANFQFSKTQVVLAVLCGSVFGNCTICECKNITYAVSHSPPLPDLPLFLKKRALLI